MKRGKAIKYITGYSRFSIVLLIIMIVTYFFFAGTDINEGIAILSIVIVVYTLWQTFFAKDYNIDCFILNNDELRIQKHKGFKIKNINIDTKNLEKFWVNVNVDSKNFYIGKTFEIIIQIDLNNGQHYEMKNYTNKIKLFEILAKAVKLMPNARIFLYSNIDKGLYSQESLKCYIENFKYPKKNALVRYTKAIAYAILIIIFLFLIFQ